MRKKIIGAVSGNHEDRLVKIANYNPLETLCAELGVEFYGISVSVRFDVGSQKYFGYFHHTTGGGGTPGGKLNRTHKLIEIYPMADFVCSAHSHQLHSSPTIKFIPNEDGTRNISHRIVGVGCGHYLDYANSYAEKAMLQPAKIGSPRIRLNGEEKDVHVSF